MTAMSAGNIKLLASVERISDSPPEEGMSQMSLSSSQQNSQPQSYSNKGESQGKKCSKLGGLRQYTASGKENSQPSHSSATSSEKDNPHGDAPLASIDLHRKSMSNCWQATEQNHHLETQPDLSMLPPPLPYRYMRKRALFWTEYFGLEYLSCARANCTRLQKDEYAAPAKLSQSMLGLFLPVCPTEN